MSFNLIFFDLDIWENEKTKYKKKTSYKLLNA